MRLLDRYLLRELMVPFGYCLSGFLVFFIAFDLLDELSSLQKLRLHASDVLEYYAVKMPEMVVTVLPVAFLLALLYTLTNLARHQEITAIRAAGVSLMRLAMPYAVVGFFLSLGVFAINVLWAPSSSDRAEDILNRYQSGLTARQKVWEPKLGFVSGLETRNWFIEAFHKERFFMQGVHVDSAEADGSRMKLTAERGWWETNTWVFTNVHIVDFAAGGLETGSRQYATLAVPEFTETPEQIRSEIKLKRINHLREVRRAQLSVKEILDYRRLHPGGTRKDSILETKLHGRLAAPWTCLVVVLIALPFGAASGRHNVVVGVAISILICFTYFMLGQLALGLGVGEILPGWLAAWAPNGLFAAAGIALTLRVR
jgi:LPS export ABC transporter permease LptG